MGCLLGLQVVYWVDVGQAIRECMGNTGTATLTANAIVTTTPSATPTVTISTNPIIHVSYILALPRRVSLRQGSDRHPASSRPPVALLGGASHVSAVGSGGSFVNMTAISVTVTQCQPCSAFHGSLLEPRPNYPRRDMRRYAAGQVWTTLVGMAVLATQLALVAWRRTGRWVMTWSPAFMIVLYGCHLAYQVFDGHKRHHQHPHCHPHPHPHSHPHHHPRPHPHPPPIPPAAPGHPGPPLPGLP